MKNAFILFPINLYEIKYLSNKGDGDDKKKYDYYLIEEELYFGSKKRINNFNKLKLLLHRASMKYYENYLKKNGFKVWYIDYPKNAGKKSGYNFAKKYDEIHIFDPTDHLLLKKMERLEKSGKIKSLKIHETPNFLCTREMLAEYDRKTKHNFFHKNFYKWQLKNNPNLGLKKSYDIYNRKPLPEGIKIPKLPANDNETKFVIEAKKYINKYFPDNYGNVDNMVFPITHKTAKKWLQYFLKHKLEKFGIYQDAIDVENAFLFHSCLSPMLNIGLLHPQEVVDEVKKYYKKHGKKIKINNYEGFIRQIIGWREYERYLYLYAYDQMIGKNYFNNRRKLSKKWYTGETGIFPIDNTIRMAFRYGYLHHINRLMVMANFMNLCQIRPDEVYRWFMEFALDSYDWVMVPNVYGMATYADGGLTMTKPYLSSDNYIMKMSNYERGDWNQVWEDLYYNFLNDKEKKIEKTVYARNLYHWKKRKDKKEVIKRARRKIKEITGS